MMAGLRARIQRLWPLPKPAARKGPGTNAVLPPAWAPWRRWQLGLGAVLLLMLGAVGRGESLGWPFLAGPVERALSTMLDRRVSLSAPAEAAADKAETAETAEKTGPSATAFRVRFFGSVRVRAPWLEIAAPPWSGAPLRIDSLHAATLDSALERVADGRASWQFRPAPAPGDAEPPRAMPVFGRLQIAAGTLRVQDARLDIDMQARVALRQEMFT